MKINVYANGCGTGKTTMNKRTIRNNPREKYLIIVPSINLAEDYRDVAVIVTSRDTDTSRVQARLSDAVADNVMALVITHTAFLNCEFKSRLLDNRHVIQDEALSIYQQDTYKEGSHKNIFIVSDTPIEKTLKKDKDWFSVSINHTAAKEFIEQVDFFEDNRRLKNMYSSGCCLWTNTRDDSKDRMLFAVTRPDIYEHAKSVSITCANFTYTLQYHLWRTLFSTDFRVIVPFVPYKTPNLRIHYAQQSTNSKTYNTKHNNIRETVIAYITELTPECVFVDNNWHNTHRKTWIRVEHNCHGDNSNITKTHVAFLSSINYTGIDVEFLRQVARLDYLTIRYSLVGELMHQVVMRGALRQLNRTTGINDSQMDIYLMESDIARYAQGVLFPDAEMHLIPNTERIKSEPVAKQAKISTADKNKASSIRKNYNQYKDIKTRDMMIMPIWNRVSARGLIK